MSTKILAMMKLDQRLAMNQQLRQAISLLQYNALELKQMLQQQIESNPLIDIEEMDSSDEEEPHSQYSADFSKHRHHYGDDNSFDNYSKQKSLRDHLLEQTLLCGFDQLRQTMAESIIDSLDENGYLTMSLEEIQLSAFGKNVLSNDDLESILKTIQQFDPVGIASRSIKECLLVQLEHYPEKDSTWKLVEKIVNGFSETISAESIKQILKKLKISQQELTATLNFLKKLNIYPGAQHFTESTAHIEPELYVKKVGGRWQVFLRDNLFSHIKINNQYVALIKKNKHDHAYSSLRQELEEARWLINGLKKRNETLFNVATYIMKLQNDFLDRGAQFMRPLNIVDVANALGLHESTVSRVTTGKYIATPQGVLELKFFFPSHVSTETGELCSAIAVKSFIKEIISQETAEHIYSDSDIVELLQKKGIKIARRTVAKYREAMNILSSYQRQMQHGMSSLVEPELAGAAS